jgi:sulfite reductase (NADPH) hemoprotein beta-component
MLRVAIPYGTLNSRQMRQLAMIAERWDKGYGHFTTRQNIQFNWPKLEDVPDILQALADVEMHAIQTSGNTIRNVTADHFAGAAADEIADPRPIAELIRQWSTDHPEFQFLPRKFKIAVTGSPHDRAVTQAHDIGLRLTLQDGLRGFEVIVGGGLGRTPMIGKTLSPFVPLEDILPYLEAVVSTYNLLGRRDNKYKARIKITTHDHGIDNIKQRVDAQFAKIKPSFTGEDMHLLKEIERHFEPPDFKPANPPVEANSTTSHPPAFRAWLDTNITPHKAPGYAIVSVSLKKPGATPGDASAAQMRALADIARDFGHDELRISHEQNVILPHVHNADLPQVYHALRQADLAIANIGLISDIIACPGMDYCALATARSIPVAQQIATRFHALKLEHDIGPLKLKISGCINACGHHHVGHIGILGLEKAGVESYQITLGGDAGADAEIGTRAGPGFGADEIVPAIERLLLGYLQLRIDRSESFLAAYRRLGLAPFKALLYPQARKAA